VVDHEDAMPGFYEHDEADAEMSMDAGAVDDTESEDPQLHQMDAGDATIPQPRPRPPVSAPARTSSGRISHAVASTSSGSSIQVKPHSTSYIAQPSEAASSRARTVEPCVQLPPPERAEGEATKTGLLECPICAKTLETDNRGFNAHVDFCLSRGAIMEAQSKAKTPTKGFKSWEKKITKASKGKKR
jgi:DNA polymerase kappa